MFVEIISIGNELLSGRTIDTNSTFLCKELTNNNFIVNKLVTVSDNVYEIKEQIEKSIEKSNIVITTGGLGPTLDDLTKKAIFEIFNKDTALILKNTQGSALGYLFITPKGILAILPGVPIEMIEMFKKILLPYILKKFKPSDSLFSSKINLILISEIEVDLYIRKLKEESPLNVNFGIYPMPGLIKIHITSNVNEKSVNSIKTKIIKHFNSYVFPENKSINEAIYDLLVERELTISTAESCSGGSLALSFTSIPGASNCFKSGIVAYDNEIKKELLGVHKKTLEENGAVSNKTAVEMIHGLFNLTNIDIAIATTGIAGPTGGSEQKPVGTIYIAIGEKNKWIKTKKYQFKGNRELVMKKTVSYALGLLWRKLKYNKFD
jgi:nicotinamide-nucleotide amidase